MHGNDFFQETNNIVGSHPKLAAIIYCFGWVGIGLGVAATELDQLSGKLRLLLLVLSLILAVGAGIVKREEYKLRKEQREYWKRKNNGLDKDDNPENEIL